MPLHVHAERHRVHLRLQSQREVKRFFKREKREQQHREQAAAAEANAFQLPRSALGAPPGCTVELHTFMHCSRRSSLCRIWHQTYGRLRQSCVAQYRETAGISEVRDVRCQAASGAPLWTGPAAPRPPPRARARTPWWMRWRSGRSTRRRCAR